MRSAVEKLAEDVLKICKQRHWSTDWSDRGVYLHLEASELIESLRGKGDSTPADEAGDVLFVLMSITESRGIPFSDVVDAARRKVDKLETLPPYEGEERQY